MTCSHDLDLDPMTLIHELNLAILKMYLLTNKHSIDCEALLV